MPGDYIVDLPMSMVVLAELTQIKPAAAVSERLVT